MKLNILETCAFSFRCFPFNQTEPQQIVAEYISIYIKLRTKKTKKLKSNYLSKISNILSDDSKFIKVTSDPTDIIKKKANLLIVSINAPLKTDKVTSIIGECKPGYLYGNAKIHKKDIPLRPIISQCPTPTYNLVSNLLSSLTS